jgi:hypothetical protein
MLASLVLMLDRLELEVSHGGDRLDQPTVRYDDNAPSAVLLPLRTLARRSAAAARRSRDYPDAGGIIHMLDRINLHARLLKP